MSGEGVEDFLHRPVLLSEVALFLKPGEGRIIVDATLGTGGHSLVFLKKGALVIGIDCDEDAVKIAEERLSSFKDRLSIVCSNYVEMPQILKKMNIKKVDGILLDLGLSSLQLSDASRGFSFQKEGPLDMRMSKSLTLTAGDILERSSLGELVAIFKKYGEEKLATRIARKIVLLRERGKEPGTTLELADLIRKVATSALSRRKSRRIGCLRVKPVSRVFQALRIAVNHELDNLQKFMSFFDEYLNSGGRIAVISYHSLEDRIVKQEFRAKAMQGKIKILTKKIVRPSREEVMQNPRARSARLRVAEKL